MSEENDARSLNSVQEFHFKFSFIGFTVSITVYPLSTRELERVSQFNKKNVPYDYTKATKAELTPTTLNIFDIDIS